MMSPCLIFRNRGAAATLLELSEQGRNRAKNPSALSKARDRSPAPINDRRRRRLLCRGAKESYSPCRSRVRVSSLSVCLAVKPVGEPDAVAPHVRLCVQRRLACSAGDKPAGARVRGPVAWIAGRRETEFLKPID